MICPFLSILFHFIMILSKYRQTADKKPTARLERSVFIDDLPTYLIKIK
jgi:hypothetical protein